MSNSDADKDLAAEFVSTIVVEKWAAFGLPETLLAKAMVAHGAATLALLGDRHQVAKDLRALAAQLDGEIFTTQGSA